MKVSRFDSVQAILLSSHLGCRAPGRFINPFASTTSSADHDSVLGKRALLRIQRQLTTVACMEASRHAGVHPRGVRLCPDSDARAWLAVVPDLEKVSLNPRTSSGRGSSFFRRHGTVSSPVCWGPGSNHGLASFVWGNQGRTHPLLSLERCIGRARSHESSANTSVLVL